MPWYFPWSDSIKKRACRYLLQHYLGHFLKEKLTLDQLSVDLYNGTGTIHDVLLDVASLNEALNNFNVPVEIVDGFVGRISVTIPWSALVSDSTMVEIHNLELTIQPKQRTDQAGLVTGEMLDSMFNSMTTSLQLAQECLKQDQTEGEHHAEAAQPFEGLEMFAQTIEAVLTRIKVSFLNTIVRLEHLPREAKSGAALEIRVDRVEYFDDLATDTGSSVDKTDGSAGAGGTGTNKYEPAAIAQKNFHLMGVTVYCDEFLESQRTFSRSPSEACSPQSPKWANLSTSPELPPGASIYHSTIQSPPEGSTNLPSSDPIKIMGLLGRQEVKVKVKQNDELTGPKLELDCHLGSVNIHLSPRQVHLLLEIGNGLAMPGSCDDSNMRRHSTTNKPMSDTDYERIERELQRQLQQERLGMHHEHNYPGTWSDEVMTTQSLDDEDETLYYDISAGSVSGTSSMESSVSSSIKSSSTSSSAFFNHGSGYVRRSSPFKSTLPQGARKLKSPHKKDTLPRLDDPSAELTRYRLKVSFLSAVVLHEDPPAVPSDGIEAGSTSTDKLKQMADQFFGRVLGIATSGMGTDLSPIRERFTEACPFDHLGFLGKPLTLECNQRSSAHLQSMEFDLTIGLAEVVECVFDRRGTTHSILGFSLPIDNILPDYCPLLTFIHDDPGQKAQTLFSSMQATSAPCVRMKINSIDRNEQASRRSSFSPKTEVHIELAHCKTEVDITIVDRIQALLSPQPLRQTNGNGGPVSATRLQHSTTALARQAYFSQAIDETAGSDRRTTLNVSSASIELKLRFPIPDLRNDPGLSKLPWWRRSLRKEVLLLDVTNVDFQTTFNSADFVSKYELLWKEAQILFQESADQEPVLFGKVNMDNLRGPDHHEDNFDRPRLVISVYPEQNSLLEEENLDVDDSIPIDSLNGACQFSKPKPSPFSSQKAMYENEELVMPGDRQETREFIEKSRANTRVHLDLNLPNVHAILPSKDFFELIYNRLNNDLLMWEPLAPAPISASDMHQVAPSWGLDLTSQLLHNPNVPVDRFLTCKSGIQYDSSSDSEEEMTGQFYSIHEAKQRERRKQHQEPQNRQSNLCFTLTIGQGQLAVGAPLRDEENKVCKEKQGEFVLDISDGTLFTVIGYNCDPDLRYMCLHANRATLFHAGCLDKRDRPKSLYDVPLVPASELVPTIYLSEPGVQTKLAGQVGRGSETRDMVSVALRIKVDTFRNVKEFQVALGIRGGTLRHRTPNTGQSWFTQMLDFFDVIDQPILGYTMPKVVTELHCHLWSCAIDYRPLHLPLRALLAVETFSISSNIIAESPTSLLRFTVDDAALYISDKCNVSAVDLRKNYVCVIDLGLFELSLRTSDGKDSKTQGQEPKSSKESTETDTESEGKKYAKLDLRASNNIVHVRTCSDTCSALADLIKYLAADGDLDECVKTDTPTPTPLVSEESVGGSPQMTQSHMEQVHDMMADAMRESGGSDSSDGEAPVEHILGGPTKVFFFPDEGKVHLPEVDDPPARPAPPPPQTSTLLAYPDIPSPLSDLSESLESSGPTTEPDDVDPYHDDEEFCIIDDPGLGIAPRDGEPTIRVLVAGPIVVTDNHFQQPISKSDALKAPEHFPAAFYRYTLREMSIVWHMYGGHDLSLAKGKDGSTTSQHVSRPKSSSSASTSSVSSCRMGRIGWQARGGPGRNIDTLVELQLNKVRLQHEVFPDNTEQASRQILLIHEVEIRDRLVSSKINKFLYQYTSEALPRQAHANMVVVKALHHRPDPTLPAQECSLKVSLLPLRLNIDQDALFFMRKFFTSIGSDSRESSPVMNLDVPVSPAKGTVAPPPVMGVAQPGLASQTDPESLLIMFDEIEQRNEEEEESQDKETDDQPKQQPVYFKSFLFSPDVPIRLDYHGKRVDMEQGTLAGILVGLAQLNCSELRLKRINHRHGLLGYDRLMLHILNEWIQDIKKNQLASILGGVGPMHSFVQLVQGIRDLFWLPVEQYRKDGRIVRGIQRGAHSFTTSTAMAALELTNRLVQSVQYVAEVAYDMVSPGPSVRQKRYYKRQRRAARPADLRQGVSNAYHVVKEGVTSTAATIGKVAQEEHKHKGAVGAVGGVLRQIPSTMFEPLILATEATSNVLSGMRNQIRPDMKREDEDKWKPEDS